MPASLNDKVAFIRGSTAGTPGGAIDYDFDPASNGSSSKQSFLAAGPALWPDVANISFALTANLAQAQIRFTRGSKGSASSGRRLDIDMGYKINKTGVRP